MSTATPRTEDPRLMRRTSGKLIDSKQNVSESSERAAATTSDANGLAEDSNTTLRGDASQGNVSRPHEDPAPAGTDDIFTEYDLQVLAGTTADPSPTTVRTRIGLALQSSLRALYKGRKLSALGILLGIIFGLGAWIGQNHGNQSSYSALLLQKYEICRDTEHLTNTPQCQQVIAEAMRLLSIQPEPAKHPIVQKRSELLGSLSRPGVQCDYADFTKDAHQWIQEQLDQYYEVMQTLTGLSWASDALTKAVMGYNLLAVRQMRMSMVFSYWLVNPTQLRPIMELSNEVEALYYNVLDVCEQYISSIEDLESSKEKRTEIIRRLRELLAGIRDSHKERPSLCSGPEKRDDHTDPQAPAIEQLFLPPPAHISFIDFLRNIKSVIFSSTVPLANLVWILSLMAHCSMHLVDEEMLALITFTPIPLAIDLCVLKKDLLLLWLQGPIRAGVAFVFAVVVPHAFFQATTRRRKSISEYYVTKLLALPALTIVWLGFTAALVNATPIGEIMATSWSYLIYRLGVDLFEVVRLTNTIVTAPSPLGGARVLAASAAWIILIAHYFCVLWIFGNIRSGAENWF